MIIRTPEHRLRVFVSSTLKDLAEERKAVRQAILNLRLAPVMFESGARPHPAQELYKSYLSQSQIFIAIYWQSYGWVAPDMSISGLEDEFKAKFDFGPGDCFSHTIARGIITTSATKRTLGRPS